MPVHNQSILHSSLSVEHYTPIPLIEMSRKVLGGIDYDLASNPLVNRDRVKAGFYYSKSDPFTSTSSFQCNSIFCNPPGGRVGNKSQYRIFFENTLAAYRRRCFKSGIFLGYSLELITRIGQPLKNYQFLFCVPQSWASKEVDWVSSMGRICFDKYDHDSQTFLSQKQPTHGNIIILISQNSEVKEKFDDVFSSIGTVFNG